MKKAFSYKLTLLFIALALSVALAFSFSGIKTVSAAEINSPSGYFGGSNQGVQFKDDKLAVSVKNGDTFTIGNALIIDEFELVINVPAAVKSFEITLTSDSYYAGGAFKDASQEKPDTEIQNVLSVDMTTKEIKLNDVSVNAAALAAGDIAIAFATADNVLTATVAGEAVANTDSYYKIKGADKCSAKISAEFAVDGEDAAEIYIVSVDQKVSDGAHAYLQNFVLEDGKIKDVAKPRVAANSLPMVKDGGKLQPVSGYKYSFTFTAYSVFGTVSSDSVYFEKENDTDPIWLENKTVPKNIVFNNDAADIAVKVRSADVEDIETYQIKQAVNRADDNVAPEYLDYASNTEIYEAYAKLVAKAALKDYGEDGVYSIRLGDSYEIPSLENLVSDDLDVYSSLTYTVYYKTPSNESGSTSSMKFTVSEAGDYEFFVAFKDKNGNAMEKDDFYTVDEHDSNIYTPGVNYNAVFTFSVQDDAPLYVNVPVSQGEGYLNTRYSATAFKIQSVSSNVNYTLYYNADANAAADGAGWVKIPQVADITEDYDENGFTFKDVEAISYDGEYGFTPIKKGAYKIECEVTSNNS
ncbi:MAG: hypothetical protein IJU83_00735, partial [Clostridia bacterium]|nr:hypothetical protein [Clostridia bacterium]